MSRGIKITHEAYLAAHAGLTHAITVKLREIAGALPGCPASTDGSGTCAERDAALAERQALNQKQVACVVMGLATTAHWYEPPWLQSSGYPAVIGTAFSTLAVWSQIELLARNPYVEFIEPAIGEAAKLGVAPPSIPSECPAANDSPDPKLEDLRNIRGNGRQPVLIQLREELLPPYRRSCSGDELCNDLLASGWERTIASRRMLTCVRTFIDNELTGSAPEVNHGDLDAILDAPAFPPFGDRIHTIREFGLGLTWGEALEIARHPYVGRLSTSEGLTLDVPPEDCPPDYDSPVTQPACRAATGSTSGKFTPQSQARWEGSTAPNEVVVAVRREKGLCPRPECPTGTACPELDRYNQRYLEEARASQSCVRSLIASLGGTASAEVLVLGNAFPATLTWPQIQTVASHPDVLQIDSRSGNPPP